MSDFFATIGSELSELLSFFVTVALLQNVVLTTGFGSSVALHMVRKPKNIWLFSAILAYFTVTTVLISYPIDQYMGTEVNNYWRAPILIATTVVVYVITTLVLQKWFPNFFHRVNRMLPMAAFNNLVTGIALVSNLQLVTGLGGNIGLAIGSCLGFALLTWFTAEGIERMDNPDMPEAFRGMPSTLVYLGLLALALMGFTSDFSLI